MLETLLQARLNAQSPDEYKRLQTYCSRRLQKTRSSAPEAVRLLLSSQRAWAQAMALHTETTFSRKSSISRSTGRHVASRLAKAIKYASSALNHETASNDEIATAAEAFLLLLQADRRVVRQQWSAAINPLSGARVALAKHIQNTIVSDYISTKLDPLLKLALAREGKSALGLDLARFARTEVSANANKEIEAVPELTIKFCGFDAPVEQESLRAVLFPAQEASTKLVKSAEPDFDSVIGLWDHCNDVCSELQLDASSNDMSDDDQSLAIIASYIQFNLLVVRIRRDMHGLESLPSANKLRVSHLIEDTCASLLDLPGVHSQDELVASLTAMLSYFAAKTRVSLAETKTAEPVDCLACLQSAYTLLKDCTLSSDEFGLPISSAEITNFKNEVDTKLLKQYGFTKIYEFARASSSVRSSLASQTDAYNFENPVADLEVKKLDVVPLKPVFYDIAFSYTQE